MRLKLDLDKDATARLIKQAALERRPVPWQAEVLLRKALGLPFPFCEKGDHDHKADKGPFDCPVGADQ